MPRRRDDLELAGLLGALIGTRTFVAICLSYTSALVRRAVRDPPRTLVISWIALEVVVVHADGGR